jgi:PglD N-terminal domain
MTMLAWWVVGTGMHARKVAQAIEAAGGRVLGFADEAPGTAPPLPGRPLLAPQALPVPEPGSGVFVAIGNAPTRQRLMDSLAAGGWLLPALVHPRAWVAPDARLEEGVFIAAGAVVETACHIGRGAIVDIGALVDHETRIAAFAHLRAPGCVGPRAQWPAA